ncbi:MAG: L-threonylcarbamoyladenylate synthase [Dehalococcoidia bacterium]
MSIASSEDRIIAKASDTIRSGGLVAFPTDTYYALGADALEPTAVARIFTAKGRDVGQPVPVLLADDADVISVATTFPQLAMDLAAAFWPGPLTIVLKAAPNVPAETTAGRSTVGLRVPDHELARRIIQSAGRPVTGTSANQSGFPPLKKAWEVQRELGGAVDFVVPGECGQYGAPSTVVDFSGDRPRLVRTGAISLEDMEKVIGDVAIMRGR